jgi:hypothetical protein
MLGPHLSTVPRTGDLKSGLGSWGSSPIRRAAMTARSSPRLSVVPFTVRQRLESWDLAGEGLPAASRGYRDRHPVEESTGRGVGGVGVGMGFEEHQAGRSGWCASDRTEDAAAVAAQDQWKLVRLDRVGDLNGQRALGGERVADLVIEFRRPIRPIDPAQLDLKPQLRENGKGTVLREATRTLAHADVLAAEVERRADQSHHDFHGKRNGRIRRVSTTRRSSGMRAEGPGASVVEAAEAGDPCRHGVPGERGRSRRTPRKPIGTRNVPQRDRHAERVPQRDPRVRRAMLCAPLTPVPAIRSRTPAEHGSTDVRGARGEGRPIYTSPPARSVTRVGVLAQPRVAGVVIWPSAG